MNRLKDLYNHFEEYLLVASLVFSVLLIFLQVIMRSGFNYSLSWSEELSRYIFIWQIWLGTSTALKEEKHIKLELFHDLVPSPRGKECITAAGLIIWLLFSGFLLINGWELTESMMMRKALSSGMQIPLYLVYMVLPISSLLVCVRLIPRIWHSVRLILGQKEVGS